MLPYAVETTQFSSHGDLCAATLYLPAQPGPHAVVLMAHGFAGTQEARLPAYADRFCRAGMAVLIWDYRHFGKSGGQPRHLLDIERQLQDWQAAMAFARSQPYLDASRLALWGTSFSGGHVLQLAARTPDLKAVIAQVPFVDGLQQIGRPWQALRLGLAGAVDMAQALLGRAPHRIKVVGRPGSLAALTSPDAEPGYQRLIAGCTWENEVAARIVLQLPLYRPIRTVRQIQAPVLYTIATDDQVTPARPARAAARKTPYAEVLELPGGHFDPYVPPLFETVVSAQTAFLKKHLCISSPEI